VITSSRSPSYRNIVTSSRSPSYRVIANDPIVTTNNYVPEVSTYDRRRGVNHTHTLTNRGYYHNGTYRSRSPRHYTNTVTTSSRNIDYSPSRRLYGASPSRRFVTDNVAYSPSRVVTHSRSPSRRFVASPSRTFVVD
jgi:hypothetical protein